MFLQWSPALEIGDPVVDSERRTNLRPTCPEVTP